MNDTKVYDTPTEDLDFYCEGDRGPFDLLVDDLVRECERAMEQRDKYLQTGISTASHGGSHDTCFGHILKKHGVRFDDSGRFTQDF